MTAIIPAHNMESFVERTLQSAIDQTYAPLEIIVIEDGSTDRTPEIVREIAAANANVRVVAIANSGVAAARNLGTELATTPFVAYLDADDLWHPRKIERQMSSLVQHGRDREWVASYTYYRRIDDLDNVFRNGPAPTARGAFFEEQLLWNPIGNGSSLLVNRDAALEVGGFNSAYAEAGVGGCEDLEFQLKLLRSFKIELVPEYLVGYRMHERQMSRDVRRMQLSRIAVLGTVLSRDELNCHLQRRTLARAHLIATHGFLEAGDWLGAGHHLARSFRLSLPETLNVAGRVAADRLRARIDGSRSSDSLVRLYDARMFDRYDPCDFTSGGGPIRKPVSLSHVSTHDPGRLQPPSAAE